MHWRQITPLRGSLRGWLAVRLERAMQAAGRRRGLADAGRLRLAAAGVAEFSEKYSAASR
eukprot:COSAG02_NODE_11871_length_1637_cov_2.647465_1_plen_60_part_00